MVSSQKPDVDAQHAGKTARTPGKWGSAKEEEPSGIRKPRPKIRGIKLAAKNAAAAVAIAAGLGTASASLPASAREISAVVGLPRIDSSLLEPAALEGYEVHLPKRFARFAKGESVSSRSRSLEAGSRKFLVKRNGGKSIFKIGDDAASLEVVAGPSTVEFRPFGSSPFFIDFSAYGMDSPVARMEEKGDGNISLHILDEKTGTDLVLSFPPALFSAMEVRAKAFREGIPIGYEDIIEHVEEIEKKGQMIINESNPQNIEDAREVYSRAGAEMVNLLREQCKDAPPELAVGIAKRGQAAITAILLRFYVLDDKEALEYLDALRRDPALDKKKLENFALKNGVLEEFRKIWPQCGALLEE
ncbi:MAG: hypothetical protein QXH30_00315 [Candidatus Bilamarchaeaceae archaeon]